MKSISDFICKKANLSHIRNRIRAAAILPAICLGIQSADAAYFTVDGINYSSESYSLSQMLGEFAMEVEYDSEINLELGANEVYVTKVNQAGETLVIPDKVTYDGVEYTVKGIGCNAVANNSSIRNVSLPDLVFIGDEAFAGAVNLEYIDLSQLEVLGDEVFYGCENLRNADLSNLKFMGAGVFANCTLLGEVKFPYRLRYWDTRLTFSGCPNVNPIFPEWSDSFREEGDVVFYLDKRQEVGIQKYIAYIKNRDITSFNIYDYFDPQYIYIDPVPIFTFSLFENLDNLESVTLQDLSYPTLSVRIGHEYPSAFRLPSSVNRLRVKSTYVDYSDDNLWVYPYDVTPWHYPDVTLECPAGTGQFYADAKRDDGSPRFIFKSIEEYGLSVFVNNERYGTVACDGNTVSNGDFFDVGKATFTIKPTNDLCYVESVTLNDVDITSQLVDGSLSLDLNGVPGVMRITFGTNPGVYCNYDESLGQVFVNGNPVKSGEPVLGTGKYEMVYEAAEHCYVFQVGNRWINDKPERYTEAITVSDMGKECTVKFRKSASVAIEYNEGGDIYVNGKHAENGETVYSNKGEFNLHVVPSEGYTIHSLKRDGYDVTSRLSNRKYYCSYSSDSHVVLSAEFIQEQEPGVAELTIKSAQSHSTTHYYPEGTEARVLFQVEDGWRLHSVTLNGEDVTSRLQENEYITPALAGQNRMDVVMEKMNVDIPVPDSGENDINVVIDGNTVSVIGLADDDMIVVYDMSGHTIYSGTEHTLRLRPNTHYILTASARTFKFVL